jgi:hypothetical protein
MSEIDDESLMQELAEDFGVQEKPGGRSPLEQRILAGFEEIQRFVEQHGRLPEHGEDRDIFERLYAVRLDRLRRLPECRAVLQSVDTTGILGEAPPDGASDPGAIDDSELQAELSDLATDDEVTKLVHVRPHEDREAAEEVAQRRPCADFEEFRPVFDRVQAELASGVRATTKFEHTGTFEIGDLFILSGQTVLVAGAETVTEKNYGREDRRLRVIFDNGTESNLWLRSLQRALYKDARNRRILPADTAASPLFSGEIDESDVASGTVYVLRSNSDHAFVKQHRSTIHKIGVTGGNVTSRIAQAKKDPTFLLADVEVVATFKLANIDRTSLEAVLHKFLSPVRLDVELKDRFGGQVEPREWFLVPLPAIEEMIQRVMDGSICNYRYDPATARLVKS